jgi:hypothetical protein
MLSGFMSLADLWLFNGTVVVISSTTRHCGAGQAGYSCTGMVWFCVITLMNEPCPAASAGEIARGKRILQQMKIAPANQRAGAVIFGGTGSIDQLLRDLLRPGLNMKRITPLPVMIVPRIYSTSNSR